MIVARSLRSELRFICPNEEIARHMAYVEATPEMVGVDLEPVDIPILDLGGGFYDFEPPYDGAPGSARHLVERAHHILRERLMAETPGVAVLHAASLVIEGRRCLIMADKGSGKTTTMLKALREGIGIEGDEHVAVYPDHVLARPRTLRVKESSLDLAGELRERIAASPMIADWNGAHIYSLAPRSEAVEWRIAPGQADVIVKLRPNHHALTSVARMPWQPAFASLLENAFLPTLRRGAALGNLQRLARAAPAWEMRIGDLDRAIWHLRHLCMRV